MLATEGLLLTPYVSDPIQKDRVDDIKDAMSKTNKVGMHTLRPVVVLSFKWGREPQSSNWAPALTARENRG